MDKNCEGRPAGSSNQNQQVGGLVSIILSVYLFNVKGEVTNEHALNLQQNMIEYGLWDINGNPLLGNFIYFFSCNDLFCYQMVLQCKILSSRGRHV